jgi:hypothetical protein
MIIPAALAAAALLTSGLAGPAVGQEPEDRAAVDALNAATTPTRDRSRPYTFTTTGKVTPPPRYCAAGARPNQGQGGQNCVPTLCPPGQANKEQYCFQPGARTICSGTVTVRFQKRNATISSRNVQLRPDCTYSSRVTFSTLSRTRRGVLRVRARFQGNSVLMPKSSAVHQVRAG